MRRLLYQHRDVELNLAERDHIECNIASEAEKLQNRQDRG